MTRRPASEPPPAAPAAVRAPSPREKLLAKAIEYYAEHGVRDTSLRTLAAAIGTSQRMLNYHFGSREDLLVAVLQAVVAADTATLERIFAEHEDPFDAGRANWEAVAAQAARFGALYFELASHAMYRHPYATDLGESLVEQTERVSARLYERYVDPVTATRLARLSAAVGRGLLFATLIDGDRQASDAAVELYASMVRALLPYDPGAAPRPGKRAGAARRSPAPPARARQPARS